MRPPESTRIEVVVGLTRPQLCTMREQLAQISKPIEATAKDRLAFLSFAIVGLVLVLDVLLILQLMNLF